MNPQRADASRNPMHRICPHVTMVALVTPTVWIALLYMLLVR